MIHIDSVTIICDYCNAEIERRNTREALEALAHHQQYVQCIKNY